MLSTFASKLTVIVRSTADDDALEVNELKFKVKVSAEVAPGSLRTKKVAFVSVKGPLAPTVTLAGTLRDKVPDT